MMDLGHIQINHPNAFIEARDKVRTIAELFAYDSLAATRFAVAVSQMCHALFREPLKAEIFVAISNVNERHALVLTFRNCSRKCSLEQFAPFFDRIDVAATDEEQRDITASSRLPRETAAPEVIDRARSVLHQKSRDELMAEVKAKNLELEQYGANLERTVRERTRELELAGEQMRANEERIRLLLESVGDGIFGVDKSGVVNFINPTALKLLGFEAEEMLGQKVHPLIHHTRENGSPYPVEECSMYHAFTEGITAHVDDEVLWRKDGVSFPVEYTSKPMLKDGEINGSVVVFRDITERRRAERQLAEAKEAADSANKAKGDFLANMSHEIRTPMNAIIGMSHLCLGTDLTARQRDYVEKVHGSAQSLLGIINDILDFSKVEAGKLEIESIPFRLDDVLDNLGNLTALKAQEKGLELLFDIHPDVPRALIGDPLRLGQVLLNLTGNAVKFTERGEIVVHIAPVRVSDEEADISIAIEDTGIGMTLDQCGKLFQSFSQADTSTTRKFGGTGLGLAISKKLVELMGGGIRVESEPGVGTTFSFNVVFGRAAEMEEEAETTAPVDLDRLRVLVVDDVASSREILNSMLSSFSFRATCVDSGEAALTALQEASEDDPYRLVLMDWQMPGLDGIEASRRIKGLEKLQETPTIIMVTAYGREEVVSEAEEAGLSGFLVKPFTPSSLLDTIIGVFGDKGGFRRGGRGEDAWKIDKIEGIHGACVLLVEDNKINQQVAQELLSQAGLVVTVAENGREAVSNVEQKPFDAVLMDLQMPEMDGYEATRAIRGNPAFAELPIIAMTANAMAGDREECIAAGMNDHVAKPIDPKELFKALVHWIPEGERTPADDDAGTGKTESADEDLPQGGISGIDIDFALGRVGGNRKLLRKLLADFYNDHASDADEIKDALDRGDDAVAQRLAHTIKGVSATIGAHQLSETAAAIESALKDNDRTAGAELVGSLEDALLPVMQGLKQLVEPPAPAGAGDDDRAPAAPNVEEIRPLIDDLATMLEDMDPDAEEKALALKGRLKSTPQAKLAASLAKQASNFDFDEAKGTLAMLREDLKLNDETEAK